MGVASHNCTAWAATTTVRVEIERACFLVFFKREDGKWEKVCPCTKALPAPLLGGAPLEKWSFSCVAKYR